MNIWERLSAEFEARYEETVVDLVEPNEDERRNGWDAQSLTQYLRERETANQIFIDPHSHARALERRPRRQNIRFNPMKWRQQK